MMGSPADKAFLYSNRLPLLLLLLLLALASMAGLRAKGCAVHIYISCPRVCRLLPVCRLSCMMHPLLLLLLLLLANTIDSSRLKRLLCSCPATRKEGGSSVAWVPHTIITHHRLPRPRLARSARLLCVPLTNRDLLLLLLQLLQGRYCWS